MESKLLSIPQMILIGSSGRNSGKTTLAVEMINRWKNKSSIIALKITSLQEKNGKCQRGGEGCGACSHISGNFELIEETNKNANKDTSLLLAAGAEKVYWLKSLRSDIYSAIKFFMSMVPPNTLIICESNSLRKVVLPGSFIMLNNTKNGTIKKSASEVIEKADLIIEDDFRNDIDSIIKKIESDLFCLPLNLEKGK